MHSCYKRQNTGFSPGFSPRHYSSFIQVRFEKCTGTPRNIYQMCFDQCVQRAELHFSSTSRNMLACLYVDQGLSKLSSFSDQSKTQTFPTKNSNTCTPAPPHFEPPVKCNDWRARSSPLSWIITWSIQTETSFLSFLPQIANLRLHQQTNGKLKIFLACFKVVPRQLKIPPEMLHISIITLV